MTTGIALWVMALFAVTITTHALFYLIRKDYVVNLERAQEREAFIVNVSSLLSKAYSFAEIVDSKFVGLATFLIANYFTGAVNISMVTVLAHDSTALLLLLLNAFLFSFIPYSCYYLYHRRRRIRISLNNISI